MIVLKNFMPNDKKPQTARLARLVSDLSERGSSQARQEEEKKSLKVEILEQMGTLATSGFGLVAALAWNDAIKALFSKIFPKPGDNIFAMIAYAAVITVLVVLITVQLGRTLNLAKKQLERHRDK